MSQYIPTYEALDVLATEWGLNGKAFYDHIVRENEANDKLEAGNILRGRGTYRNHSDWLEPELLGNGWLNYTPCCSSVNHALSSNRLRDFKTSLLKGLLHRGADPHPHVH